MTGAEARAERTGDMAVRAFEEAAAGTSAENPDRAAYPGNLGIALRIRFGRARSAQLFCPWETTPAYDSGRLPDMDDRTPLGSGPPHGRSKIMM